PRITEDDVVRLAAKRPTFPDVQAEIAQSPKWSVRVRVRLALVQNPFTPPAISVPLLPMLVRPELDQVMAATDVPPIVRSAVEERHDDREHARRQDVLVDPKAEHARVVVPYEPVPDHLLEERDHLQDDDERDHPARDDAPHEPARAALSRLFARVYPEQRDVR